MMLSGQNGASSKSKSVASDQKERESIIPDTDDAKNASNAPNDDPEHGTYSGLSTRAQSMKDSLATGSVVKAVLLSSDGKTKQIEYDTSSASKSINKIIGSRVTVIGAIEELNAIAVGSLTPSSSSKNKTQLPYPLCQSGSISGNVLIYRCDENAIAQDLSIDEYSKYCATNKDLTEKTIKESGSNDERAIHPQSHVPNDSGYTLDTLSSELSSQYRSLNESASQSDIDSYVTSKIDSILEAWLDDTSPLNDPTYDVEDDESNDPDYNPNNATDQRQKQLDLQDDANDDDSSEVVKRIKAIYYRNNGIEIDDNELDLVVQEVEDLTEQVAGDGDDDDSSDDDNERELDETEWRSQLNEALNFVRAKAKVDGQHLAEKVRDTYYECNGSFPTTSNLEEIFIGIQAQLATEAITDARDAIDDNADSDYDPNNAIDQAQKELDLQDEQNELESRIGGIDSDVGDSNAYESDVSEANWRAQLDDALNYVRAKGRADGKQLAETVSQLYYETNGEYPTETGLITIFEDVQQTLATNFDNDEQVDDDDDEDDDDNVEDLDDDGTAYNYAEINEIDDIESADPVDLVEYSSRILSENLISQVVSSFEITKRRTPTVSELRESIYKKTDEIGQRMVNIYENDYVNFNDGDEQEEIDDDLDEEVGDSDYDVDNEADAIQEELDIEDDDVYAESVDHEDADSGLLLQSQIKYSKLNGNGESYSIYFGKLPTKKEELTMLDLAIDSFEMRNDRSPNVQELNRLKATCFVGNRSEIRILNSDNTSSDLVVRGTAVHQKTKLLVTPVKTKKNRSARYDILLDQESVMASGKKEKTAIEWFERFNNRKPSKAEIENIRKFVEVDNSDLKLELFDVVDNDEKTDNNDTSKMRSVNIKANKATKYTLEYTDQDNNDGDVNSAIKWFERFNNRKPNQDELENIYAFTRNDSSKRDSNQLYNDDLKEDTIDID